MSPSIMANSEINIHGQSPGLFRKRNPTGHSMTSLQRISLVITGTMETLFCRWGFLVASHPKKIIASCLLFTALCGLGMFNFRMEGRPEKLWIPKDSEFARNTEFMRTKFPSPIRTSWTLITADNVLVPEVMRVVIDIHEKVKQIQTINGKGWNDICYRLPVTKFLTRRRRRSVPNLMDHSSSNYSLDDLGPLQGFDEAFDDDFFGYDENIHSVPNQIKDLTKVNAVPDEIYCSVIEDLDQECWETSIAEMWSFNRSLIYDLPKDEILRVLNHQHISPIFGRPVNYSVELGGNIVKDENGQIVSAQSMILRWAVKVDLSVLTNDKTGETADRDCLDWELEWLDLMKNISESSPPGINVHFVNMQSWMEISEATLMDDGITLAFGFVIMFFYVGIMLGKFNVIEQRPFLAMAGLSCVGLSCIISYGLCSFFNIPSGPINKILAFLLLGIGIDDMFVIIQCWTNLYPNCLTKKFKQSIPERMGMALKHAGVSITVTSLTDVAAFAVGSSTMLEGLRSFCIYSAVGIIAIFVLQATYFVAWFALDQKRVEERRNAFFPWIQYKDSDFVPSPWSQQSYLQTFFDKVLGKYLFKAWAKVLVMTVTAALLGVTVYGNTLLRQEFDPMWFLPSDSYMTQYVKHRDALYPGTGYPAFVVANGMDWPNSITTFDNVLDKLQESGHIFKFENWLEDFKEYANLNFDANLPNKTLTSSQFRKYMGKFLFSPVGSKYRAYFKVDGNFTCGASIPGLKTAIMPFRFKKFKGPEEHIPAFYEVRSILRSSNVSFDSIGKGEPGLFIFGTATLAWYTDEIITGELYRNVSLSLIVVLLTTFLLLANFRVCFLSGLCVIFTLVNVGGFMYFWGLTIDTVSCIDIVLAVGLCVDYAAHIALAFMQCAGTKDSRAKRALKNIGPAVLNGGFSTFLAILLLANSQSHAFKSFFKIFTVVIICGLYHGLIVLPVLLSLFGPEPYPFASTESDENTEASEYEKDPKIVELKTIQGSLMDVSVIKDANNANHLFSTNAPLLIDPLKPARNNERTQQ